MAQSGQKTELPTPKRLRDARKEGQVAKSKDLSQALVLVAALLLLVFMGEILGRELWELMATSFQADLMKGETEPTKVLGLAGTALLRLGVLTLPLALGLALTAVLVGLLQVRPLFAPKAIKPKLERLDPIKGFKNLFFKARTWLELLKTLVKFLIILFLIVLLVRSWLPELLLTVRLPLPQSALLSWSLLLRLLGLVTLAFLLLAAADFFLQRRLHLKELMMTKEEVKREFKEEEGDPLIKQARSQLHQQILAESMLQNVASADAVVVNPSHIAVAIRYDEKRMNAPQVTAKGHEQTARKIRQLARRFQVPVLRNPPLARSLVQLNLNEEIPEELYEAVAEVLNWVYRLRRDSQISGAERRD